MIFSMDVWLLPAIAAASSSYLVCLAWERVKSNSAPDGLLAAFLAALSFLMGAICAYYRYRLYAPTLEGNVIVMFVAGATTTYFWLLLRRYLPGSRSRE
jgi:glucan phosphoethanolaminetransferase (alkaline phosphatase superfamily)